MDERQYGIRETPKRLFEGPHTTITHGELIQRAYFRNTSASTLSRLTLTSHHQPKPRSRFIDNEYMMFLMARPHMANVRTQPHHGESLSNSKHRRDSIQNSQVCRVHLRSRYGHITTLRFR